METKKTKEAVATTDLVAVQHNALNVGLTLVSVADLRAFASDVASSGILGQITPTQAEVSLVAMRDDRISIVEFKRKYQWVGQELTIRPNWLLGEFKRRGGKYEINRADRTACDMTFRMDGNEYRLCITIDDAKEMGLVYGKDGKTVKANWQKFPDDMLFARVCGKALRRVAPELMGGVYTDGEAMDFALPEKTTDGAVPRAPMTAKVEAVSASPIADAPKEEAATDCGICPCGSVKGKAWSEIPTETLEKILATPAEKAKKLTEAHRNAIVEELGRREVVEAEVVEG